jgi:hypothetical protein
MFISAFIPVWALFRSCAPLDMAAWVVLSLHAAYSIFN